MNVEKTYTVYLTLGGNKPNTVAYRLRTMLPHLTMVGALEIVVHSLSTPDNPTKICSGLVFDEAKYLVNVLHDSGADCCVRDKYGKPIIITGEPLLTSKIRDLDVKALAQYYSSGRCGASGIAYAYSLESERRRTEQAVKNAQNQEMVAEQSKNYPIELPYYYRIVLRGRERGPDGWTLDFVQQMDDLRNWASTELTGLFRIRTVVSENFRYNTLELTNEIDALYAKMRWQDDFAELTPQEVEWVWGSPARLFGNNPMSLAYEICRKQSVIHHSGEPYRFAKGVEIALELGTEPVEVQTKDILFVLAPTEDQRSTFLKYCEDYGVMVHSVSQTFDKTVVDKNLFNAIVSVDYDQMESFERIWASGFARFKRDTRANSQLVLLNSPV